MIGNPKDFDLHIGIQHSKYQIPGNFKYTKYCKIKIGKLFTNIYFQIDNLIAAGTTHGPILIYTEKSKSLSHVCILCAHISAITCIIQLENMFISASHDGTVCSWMNEDCSLISCFKNISEFGDVQLAAHRRSQQDDNVCWVYTVGIVAFLLDLNTGHKIKQLDLIGITSIAFLEPEKCLFVQEPTLVVTQFNVLNTYDINFNSTFKKKLGFRLGQYFHLCEYGFVRVTDRNWELLSTQNLSCFVEGRVRGVDKYDLISDVKWSDSKTFCVSTFSGKFTIFSLEVTDFNGQTRVKVERTVIVKIPKQTYTNYFQFFSEGRILYNYEPEKLYLLSPNGSIATNSRQEVTKMYHVPRNSSARVVECDGNNCFYVKNWEKGGNSSFKYTALSKITSLASRESPNKKLEVIVGCADGSLAFFSENSQKPYHTEVVFSSAVIGIAHLPLKIRGRPTLIAIGDDGSIALLKNYNVLMSYANYEFKINAAYYREVDECLIVRRSEMSYIVFKLNEPGPIMLTTNLPEKSVLVWSESEINTGRGPISTNQMKFGQNSWFYTLTSVSDLTDTKNHRFKMFSQLLLRLFSSQYDVSLTHSQSLNFSNLDNNENSRNNGGENALIVKSQSIQSLVDWVPPEGPTINLRLRTRHPHQKIVDGLSLVIVNNEGMATFFYPKYRICGDLIFMLANKNSATNVIFRTIISGETSENEYPELISAFTELLFCGDPKIETAASLECNRLLKSIPDQLASQLLFNHANKNHDSSLFLMAFLAIGHQSMIKEHQFPGLLHFLWKISNSDQGCAPLALSILINGYSIWSKIASEQSMFSEFIKSFVRMERPKAVEDMFFKLAANKVDVFFSSMTSLIKSGATFEEEKIKSLIGLASKVAFSDTILCGSKVSMKMVELASDYLVVAPFVTNELAIHSVFFSSVAISNEIIAIGQNNGVLSVFRNFKTLLSNRLFTSPIDYVSIGPGSRFCAVLSISEKKAKVFSLQLNGFFSAIKEPHFVEKILDAKGTHYQIYWKEPNNCYFTVVD